MLICFLSGYGRVLFFCGTFHDITSCVCFSFHYSLISFLPGRILEGSMAREFAKKFYSSPEWEATRLAYIKSVDGLCEDCLAKGIYKPGKVVHHMIHLTPGNIVNPEVALNFKNLRYLCQDCHAAQHAKEVERNYFFDEDGKIFFRPPPTKIF